MRRGTLVWVKLEKLALLGMARHGSLWVIRDFEAGGGMGYLCASLRTGHRWMFYAGAFEEGALSCPSSAS